MPIKLHLPETRYVIASLPLDSYGAALEIIAEAQGFVSLTRDKDEVSLIISEEEWEMVAARIPNVKVQRGRRMIAFDTVFDFAVVGFIAEISRALAEAGISILNTSTYRTDIVFVHEARFEAAVAAIKRALVTIHHTHIPQQ